MFSTSEANKIINDEFRSTDSSGDVYIGFSTTAPTETTSQSGAIQITNFTEPTSGYSTGYYRGALNTNENRLLEEAYKRQIQNKEVCYMSLLRQNLGTMTHFGLFRSKTSKDPFFYGPLTKSVEFIKDHIPVVDIGGFVVGLDKETLDEAKTWEDYA